MPETLSRGEELENEISDDSVLVFRHQTSGPSTPRQEPLRLSYDDNGEHQQEWSSQAAGEHEGKAKSARGNDQIWHKLQELETAVESSNLLREREAARHAEALVQMQESLHHLAQLVHSLQGSSRPHGFSTPDRDVGGEMLLHTSHIALAASHCNGTALAEESATAGVESDRVSLCATGKDDRHAVLRCEAPLLARPRRVHLVSFLVGARGASALGGAATQAESLVHQPALHSPRTVDKNAAHRCDRRDTLARASGQ